MNPFWRTTKPGFGKRGMQKGFLGDETINGYQESRYYCVHWCGRWICRCSGTHAIHRSPKYSDSLSGLHWPSFKWERNLHFLLDICGSHHKPLHVTVGIIIWLWLTVCHGKIHHAIKFAKASISMGLFLPWRTVSHNQRVIPMLKSMSVYFLWDGQSVHQHQPISIPGVPRGSKGSQAPMSFWHRPWWCAMS